MSTKLQNFAAVGVIALAALPTAHAQAPQASDRAKEVAATKAFWTKERINAAQPRDFVIDERGYAYLIGRGGKLEPYGHSKPATPEPRAKGGNGGGGKPGGGGSDPTDPGTGDPTGFQDVKNAAWANGGTVQTAAGRIFFIMDGGGYVCSGTLIDDGEKQSDRSVVLTAAHCVYDDVNKAFAESAIFIPNQAATSGSGTDTDCGNDPYGCWVVDFGVVSKDWDASTFPANIPSDYAFYALGVNQSDAAVWSGEGKDVAMDKVITPMQVSFEPVSLGDYTRALGYSYKDDPNFMYCGEPVYGSSYDGYLLPNCGMSGGASGGPWSQSQAADLGTGPITSVNSYGPSRGKPYMGGPKLYGTDAECLFDLARSAPADRVAGIVGC